MDKKYIIEITKNILKKSFTISNKRQIREYDDRINFACPYCGDSDRNTSAKRGNIYYDKLFYICFNCDRKTNFLKFTKDYNEILDPSKKMDMIEHLNNVISYTDYESGFMNASVDDLLDIDDLIDVINKKYTPLSDFKPIVKNGGVYKYLLKRGIVDDLQENIYQAKYWFNDDQYQWVIVMLNMSGGKLLGMQVRNLKSGKNRMFKIYSYENLLEWINIIKPEPIEMDDDKLILYNKLSHYFNILNVDMGDTVTIFEGYLDSLFYPNSIGLVGVNTDLRFLESSDMDIQYFFDNDKAGYDKAVQKIEEGFKVFLWKKLIDHLTSLKSPNDPYKYEYRISKVKDINKLCELVPGAYTKLELSKFFSRDVLDKKWIPKVKVEFYDYDNDYKRKIKFFDKNY